LRWGGGSEALILAFLAQGILQVGIAQLRANSADLRRNAYLRLQMRAIQAATGGEKRDALMWCLTLL